MPGQAFGEDISGKAPEPAGASESEFAKALRQAGFPELESKIAPQTVIIKVLSGMQKRVMKISELKQKLGECKGQPLVDRTLSYQTWHVQLSFFHF